MMFRCVQGKIGGSSEDNGGGAALGAPSARWSKVLHSTDLVQSEVKHRSHVLKVAPSPPFRVRVLPFKIQIQMDKQTQQITNTEMNTNTEANANIKSNINTEENTHTNTEAGTNIEPTTTIEAK